MLFAPARSAFCRTMSPSSALRTSASRPAPYRSRPVDLRRRERGVRITGVRTVLYEYATARAIGDVQLPGGAETTADLAVFLLTDEEPVGMAISSPGARPVIHALAESLVGCDPHEVRGLYELMLRITFKSGTGAAIGGAIGALDCALWDLRAKARDLPLWR